MPHFLILYGTTDGQTGKIAWFLASELRALGILVDVVEAGTADPYPERYDAVLVAASVHVGGYQRAVVRWTRSHAAALGRVPSAFVSVCLGVLQDSPRVARDLSAIRDRFIAQTGWTPPTIKVVAGALRYTRYGWLKRLVMRRIAAKTGGATDTTRDHEYTDWGNLRRFAEIFAGRIRQPAAHCGCEIPDDLPLPREAALS